LGFHDAGKKDAKRNKFYYYAAAMAAAYGFYSTHAIVQGCMVLGKGIADAEGGAQVHK